MIGVIADDISGAAEIAGVGLRFGLRAEVLLKGRPRGNADLVCIDTDSRCCSAAEAARRAAEAAKLLRRAGAKWIYKKVDSVLRGQVAAEILAVRKELKLKAVLLHPANPSLGRTIKDGKYFIRGRLIHKTEFARDPAHPRRTADVAKLLSRTPTFPIQVCKPGATLAETGVIICESTSARDVKSWVRKTHPEMLLAGGAEFFAALLAARLASANQRLGKTQRFGKAKEKFSIFGFPKSLGGSGNKGTRLKSGAQQTDAPDRASLELFVCGTTSQSSQKFVQGARRAGTPVFSLPGELAWGADFTRPALKAVSDQVLAALQNHPRVILQTGLPPVHEIPFAQRLAGHLTQLAEVILKQAAIKRVYAEGGATAVELARRLGWTRLTVVREVATGVTTLAVNGNASVLLTIKPGTYVWPEEVQCGVGRPARRGGRASRRPETPVRSQ